MQADGQARAGCRGRGAPWPARARARPARHRSRGGRPARRGPGEAGAQRARSRSSGHQTLTARTGRAFWAQPIGESQESGAVADVPDRPDRRTTRRGGRRRCPTATRGFSVTWAVMAVIPDEHEAERGEGRAEDDRARGRAGPAARSDERRRARRATTGRRATTASPAASGACRPTGIARTSSRRPLSSSPRVSRPTSSTLISPTITRPKAPTWKATWPADRVEAPGPAR